MFLVCVFIYFSTESGSSLVGEIGRDRIIKNLNCNVYTQGKLRIPSILRVVSGNAFVICWLWRAWFCNLMFFVRNCITPGIAYRTYDISEIWYRAGFQSLFWQGLMLGWKEKGHARKKGPGIFELRTNGWYATVFVHCGKSLLWTIHNLSASKEKEHEISFSEWAL